MWTENMNSTEQFEALVNEHYQPLFRFAMSLTHAESDASDLTQHTFYTWAAKGHQLRDGAKVKTWLYTTLHRAFLQARRRHVRFPHHDLDEVSQQLPAQHADFTDRADCAAVLPALTKVDEVFRAAVALYYLEDCSYKEIAAILEVPIGTVKSRIARGLAQLREILLSDNGAQPAPSKATAQQISPRADNSAKNDYDEWDFSSTRMMELCGAA
jgi:RNA polymerase sigma-70 factor (ECF subfamily)